MSKCETIQSVARPWEKQLLGFDGGCDMGKGPAEGGDLLDGNPGAGTTYRIPPPPPPGGEGPPPSPGCCKCC